MIKTTLGYVPLLCLVAAAACRSHGDEVSGQRTNVTRPPIPICIPVVPPEQMQKRAILFMQDFDKSYLGSLTPVPFFRLMLEANILPVDSRGAVDLAEESRLGARPPFAIQAVGGNAFRLESSVVDGGSSCLPAGSGDVCSKPRFGFSLGGSLGTVEVTFPRQLAASLQRSIHESGSGAGSAAEPKMELRFEFERPVSIVVAGAPFNLPFLNGPADLTAIVVSDNGLTYEFTKPKGRYRLMLSFAGGC